MHRGEQTKRWRGKEWSRCLLASSPPRFLTSFLLALLALLLNGASLQAEEFNRAGLVVQLGDATIITRCVTFETAQMSGVELLEQSGLAVEIATDPAFGNFVCQIETEGCPADNCLCAYPPNYWRYWWLVDSTWQFAPVGVSSRLLGNGDVDGWSWTADAPPAITFAEICPATAVSTVYLPLVVAGE